MLKYLLPVVFAAFFSSSASAKVNPTPSLSELINMQHMEGQSAGPIGKDSDRSRDLRLKKMKESALFLGIHSGFNYEIERLHAALISIGGDLDKVFDFGVLMRSTNTGQFEAFLLPGVVEEMREKVSVTPDGKSLEYIEESLEILYEERFVTEQPSWRNYLLLNPFKDYQPPFNSILPKNSSEAEIWRSAVKEGWELGVRQANQELIANSKNLRRDFIGMIKYLRASLEGKIDNASLAFTRKLVETDGEVMNVNKSNYEISSPARFNAKNGEWEILTLSTRGSLRKEGEVK
jgi:defect-in-organelle-trafficking protein DotC